MRWWMKREVMWKMKKKITRVERIKYLKGGVAESKNERQREKDRGKK